MAVAPVLSRYVVDRDTGCWVWRGGRMPFGYGSVWLDGRTRLAHRVFYERLVGPIPDGLQLDHLCRNPPCVNPAHLEPVTHTENSRRGSATKLTRDEVAAIKAALRTPERQRAIAARFGVSDQTICDIRHGRSWVDIEPEGLAA